MEIGKYDLVEIKSTEQDRPKRFIVEDIIIDDYGVKSILLIGMGIINGERMVISVAKNINLKN